MSVDGRTLPLVGRTAELGTLEAELRRAGEGGLRAVLVVGEPGVGKTRLSTELVARHAGSVLALSARAYPLGATSSLGLWAEALERHLRSLPRSDVVDLCGGDLDDLAALLPSARAARGGGDTGEPPRIRLLGALARLLARLATAAPLVVTLDDVHLADGSSWEALSYLTRNLVDCPILLILVARSAELAEDRVGGDVLLGLEQEGLLRRVPITALEAGDIAGLARALIGRPVPDPLVAWLMQRSQGSPLFAVGLLRALVDEGADLEHPSLHALPEDLSARVESRLGQLEPECRAALELMTVLGYRVELSDMVRISGQGLDDLAPILDRLVRTGLVSEIDDARGLSYEIEHPLIQEAIYASIGAARRRARHRHAARVLVGAGRVGAAAPHFVRAADPGDDEAIVALCEALRQAEEGEHHREALALLDALTELVPAGDWRWRRVLAAMPLQPEWVMDHRADAGADIGVRAMRAVEQVLRASSEASAKAAVKFNLGTLLAWGLGEVDEGHRLVDEARELFAAAGDGRHALLCANELGYLAALADDSAGHRARAEEVLARGVETDDALVELQARCSLVWALVISGQLEAAVPVLLRALSVARGADKAYRTTYLIAQHGWIEVLLGRITEGRARLSEAAAGNPAFRDTYVLDFTAGCAWLAGDLDQAVSAVRDQLAWTGGVSRRRAIGGAYAVLALAELGRHEEAADVSTLVSAVFGGRDWWVHSDLARWARATSSALQWGRGEGLAELDAAAARMTALGYWTFARFVLADLAETAVDAGAPAAATRAAAWARSDPCPPDSASQRALARFTAGAAALARGEMATAGDDLAGAADGFGAAGWALLEGRALALLGRAQAHADRDDAVAALRQAAERFERCGALVRRDRVVELLGRLGGKGRRARAAVAGPGALTRRERDVARLAAQGASTRQIAEALFIGERTVETHLANAYAKLGIGSKLELVRLGHDLDI